MNDIYEQQSLLYFSWPFWYENEVRDDVNSYVVGNFPTNFGSHTKIRNLGEDCEQCQSKVSWFHFSSKLPCCSWVLICTENASTRPYWWVQLLLYTIQCFLVWGIHFISENQSYYNQNKKIYLNQRKPMLDNVRAYMPRFVFSVPIQLPDYQPNPDQIYTHTPIHFQRRLAASFMTLYNKAHALAPSYWRNDGLETYGDVLPHSLLVSIKEIVQAFRNLNNLNSLRGYS